MKIELLPRIIDDKNIEVRENDIVMIQTKDMTDPAPAVVNNIETTLVTITFLDPIYGNQPYMLRASEIRSLVKTK